MSRKRDRRRKLPLTIGQILAWADDHHRRFGTWPYWKAGAIRGTKGETWAGVAFALCRGTRGLSKGTTLAQLLRRNRKIYSRRPALNEATIFRWAEGHYRRTGKWPNQGSGTIHDAPSENWMAVNAALIGGFRGLPPGSSLKKLLAQHGVRRTPLLTPDQILTWADAFFATH